jgi:hypothetical protein
MLGSRVETNAIFDSLGAIGDGSACVRLSVNVFFCGQSGNMRLTKNMYGYTVVSIA